jgi:hypothetical protein
MNGMLILGSMIGVAGLIAAIQQKRRSRRNDGPIQLGVGTRVRRQRGRADVA